MAKSQPAWQLLLARLALSSAAAQPPQQRPSASQIAQWQKCDQAQLSDAQREAYYAGLLQHPEAYEQWLQQPLPVRNAHRAWWHRLLPSWPIGGAWGAAVACTVLAALLWLNQPPKDALQHELNTVAANLSAPTSRALQQMPWQARGVLGFVAPENVPWRRAYSNGLQAAYQSLLREPVIAQKPDSVTLSAWYDYGRLNVLLSTMAQEPATRVSDWNRAQALLQSLQLPSDAPVQHDKVLAQLGVLAQGESQRARRLLLRQLRAESARLSVIPAAEQAEQP